MTQDTDTLTTTDAGTAPVADNNIAPVSAQLNVALPTKQQIGHVVDATLAEAERQAARLGKAIKSQADRELLARVVANAIKFQIDYRAASTIDDAKQKSLARRKRNIDSQIADLRAFATEAGKSEFWGVVNGVFDRLSKFTVAAIVAAV